MMPWRPRTSDTILNAALGRLRYARPGSRLVLVVATATIATAHAEFLTSGKRSTLRSVKGSSSYFVSDKRCHPQRRPEIKALALPPHRA